MTKIKLNWAYAKGELDTDTLKLICLPARGKRLFGADELDAELCIKDGMNYQIAEIHLGDVESSNILCEEIARRWNEHEEWHECKEDTEDIRKLKTDERLIECSCGKVNYYRFLCFHPRNTNYVILLNHCEEPERFFIQNLIDRFYTNYTSRDIITYRRDYAIKKLKEFEQALSELGDKDEL